MYLVARPFTSYGKFFAAGDVVKDISTVRNSRLKVSEGKLFFIDPLREPLMIEKVKKVAYHAGISGDTLLIRTGLMPKVAPPISRAPIAPSAEAIASPQPKVQPKKTTAPVSPKAVSKK